MYVYLLLLSGIFMGWSLGTNDAANVFGTAVSTKVVKYRTAVTLIAVFVLLGAFLDGDGNIEKVRDLAVLNGMTGETVYQNALFAAVILLAAGATVTLMSYFKIPVSTNQCITGALIGWGIRNSPSWEQNLPKVLEFASTWVLNPLLSVAICYGLVKISNRYLVKRIQNSPGYHKAIFFGYLVSGVYSSFVMGTNSVANVTALFVSTPGSPNLLDSPRIAAVLGGAAIALGVLTYSRKVMHTVGSGITKLTAINGFLVVLATGLTVQIFSSKVIGINIPVSTSQAMVGALIGAGLTKGASAVNFKLLKRIFASWIGTPLISSAMTYTLSLFIEL